MLAVLVLDALHAPLVERLLGEGRMPALARLQESGRRLPLVSSAAYLEGSVHTTLHTGLEASEHGIYSPFQWSAEEGRIRTRDSFRSPQALWDRLGAAGRRSLLIDPYDSVPPLGLLGSGVRGWQFTNRVALPPWSSPARMRRTLARRFGRPRSADEIFGRPEPRELLRLRHVLLDAPGRIADIADELIPEAAYDLIWVDFASMHLAGHQFLDAGAVTAPGALQGDDAAKLQTALGDVYEAGDGALGRVLDRLPPDADIVAVAPSGMAAETDRSDMLPSMLAAVLGDRPEAGPERRGPQLWRVRAAVPTSLRALIARALPDRVALDLTARLFLAGTDTSRVPAFAVPSDPGGAVRLNLRGRERDGVLDPGRAADLGERIAQGLLSFRDPDGAPSVTAVDWIGELEPPGPALSLLPDLSVRWRPEPAAGVSAISSERFGTVTRRGLGTGRSGNHTEGAWGIFVAGQSRPREPSRPARLVDVAATACAVLGVDRSGLAGEPLMESARAEA